MSEDLIPDEELQPPVEVRLAYVWTCTACGHTNVDMGRPPQFDSGEEDEAREALGVSDTQTITAWSPNLLCEKCLTLHRAVFPDEDDDEEDDGMGDYEDWLEENFG